MGPRVTWVTVLLGLAVMLSAAGAGTERGSGRQPEERAKGEEMTGVLAGVDLKTGTLKIGRVGVDVDDVLLEKMKQREGEKAAEEKDAAAVSLGSNAQIYIKFRTSPSVANNVTRSPDELRAMIGWPVTLKVSRRGDQSVASEVIAWRGTPWKAAPRGGAKPGDGKR